MAFPLVKCTGKSFSVGESSQAASLYTLSADETDALNRWTRTDHSPLSLSDRRCISSIKNRAILHLIVCFHREAPMRVALACYGTKESPLHLVKQENKRQSR